MPKYKVTIEARKIIDVDQTIEVEAKNKTDAVKQVQAMIDRDQIRNSAYDEISSHYCEERVGDVTKMEK